jgi:hypothetical protein
MHYVPASHTIPWRSVRFSGDAGRRDPRISFKTTASDSSVSAVRKQSRGLRPSRHRPDDFLDNLTIWQTLMQRNGLFYSSEITLIKMRG